MGFSIDLVEELVKPALEKKVGKPIKVEKKESHAADPHPAAVLRTRSISSPGR